jgi:hypothetical protein
MEPVTNPSATTFVFAIIKILLQYGFCHTAVLNKDSKFVGVCCEAMHLFLINCHVLSGRNHSQMLMERVFYYTNRGLKIMSNKRKLIQVALEAILLLIYAWNLCPVPGINTVLLQLAKN